MHPTAAGLDFRGYVVRWFMPSEVSNAVLAARVTECAWWMRERDGFSNFAAPPGTRSLEVVRAEGAAASIYTPWHLLNARPLDLLECEGCH